MLTIRFGELQAQISEHGAEVQSLVCGGKEHLWQGDRTYWSGRSPILFPICGALLGDHYTHDGKGYTMLKHGFARKSDFQVVDSGESYAVFELAARDEVRADYPFNFVLNAYYSLDSSPVGQALYVQWQVECLSDEMYFSLGGHPAFQCKLDETDIVFDHRAPLEMEVMQDALFTYHQKPMALTADQRLQLSPELLERDALFFRAGQDERVGLARRGEKPHIVMHCPDFDYFGIWSPPHDAPFVCLEPWLGSPDRVDASGELACKPQMRRLEKGETYRAGYVIEFPGIK